MELLSFNHFDGIYRLNIIAAVLFTALRDVNINEDSGFDVILLEAQVSNSMQAEWVIRYVRYLSWVETDLLKLADMNLQ